MIIFLSILKVIGIVLLVILLVLAALILLVLFAPVQYEASGNSERREARILLKWLAGVVSFSWQYGGGASQYALRLIGIPIKSSRENKKSRKRKKNIREAETSAWSEPVRMEEQSVPEDPVSENTENADPIDRADRKETGGADGRHTDGTEGEKKNGVSRNQRRRRYRGRNKFRHASPRTGRVRRIFSMIRKTLKVVERLREAEIFSFLFVRIQRLLYRIRPRKLKGSAVFGFSDPSLTGMVCGGIAAVPFLLGMNLDICPDFETEQSYFRGEGYVKGRILILWVVVFVVSVLRKKEIRQVIGPAMNRDRKKQHKIKESFNG